MRSMRWMRRWCGSSMNRRGQPGARSRRRSHFSRRSRGAAVYTRKLTGCGGGSANQRADGCGLCARARGDRACDGVSRVGGVGGVGGVGTGRETWCTTSQIMRRSDCGSEGCGKVTLTWCCSTEPRREKPIVLTRKDADAAIAEHKRQIAEHKRQIAQLERLRGLAAFTRDCAVVTLFRPTPEQLRKADARRVFGPPRTSRETSRAADRARRRLRRTRCRGTTPEEDGSSHDE